MTHFAGNAWFFTTWLLKFMIFFYPVWVPGFLLSACLAVRFGNPAWKALLAASTISGHARAPAVRAGILGSTGRKTSGRCAWELLKNGHSVETAITYIVASRNMTIHFFAILALSLGAEFALGQVLGALVMIGVVVIALRRFPVHAQVLSTEEEDDKESVFAVAVVASWSALLFSPQGWWKMMSFIGREVRGFAPTLVVGICLGGIVFAAGLEQWWFPFADISGHHTYASDLINASSAPFFSAAMFLSPVGNIPVIHALFKADGLAYPGIVSFCLASAIHPMDMRMYLRTFGRKQGLKLIFILYAASVLGGLGSTGIYALSGFRPVQPPLEIGRRLLEFFAM